MREGSIALELEIYQEFGVAWENTASGRHFSLVRSDRAPAVLGWRYHCGSWICRCTLFISPFSSFLFR